MLRASGVWEVLTQAEHVKEWWSPTGFTMIATMSICGPAACFIAACGRSKATRCGASSPIARSSPPERIVFVNSFSNEAGGVAKHPIVPTWPMETLITITLGEEPGGKTNFGVRWAPHNATEIEQKTFDAAHVGMKATWSGTLDRLAAYLAKG